MAGLEFADHVANGTVSPVSNYTALPASGHTVRWAVWEGDDVEVTDLRWENEGWTVSGQVDREQVQYVVRLSASWQVRQFLLFRDLEDPDLWLATDGTARWGEMNGAHRIELDGCYDLDLACTPFTKTLPIHRLPLAWSQHLVHRFIIGKVLHLGRRELQPVFRAGVAAQRPCGISFFPPLS